MTRAYQLIGYERTAEQERMYEKLQRDKPHLKRVWPSRYTPEHMLQALRALYVERGYLNSALILATPGVPCVDSYRRYFGSLGRAYELVGFIPPPGQKKRMKSEAQPENAPKPLLPSGG